MDIPTPITIAITRHAESLEMISGCIDNILEQCTEPIHLLILDQAGDSQLKEVVAALNEREEHLVEYRCVDTNSIAVSRNLGAEYAKGRYVIYTDPDCRVMPGWFDAIKKAFEKKGVGIVAGRVIPKMEGREAFYHKSVLVKELFAYVDRGEYPHEVSKALSSNMAIDKQLIIDALGYQHPFKENLGRTRGLLFGGEETELCRRAKKHGIVIYYQPESIVLHLTSAERMKLSNVFKRIFYHGVSRANVGGIPEPMNMRFNMYDIIIMPVFLAVYAVGYLYGKSLRFLAGQEAIEKAGRHPGVRGVSYDRQKSIGTRLRRRES